MSCKFEKIDGNKKAKYSIVVSPEDFKEALQKAYQKNKGKFNIPGFRKGKAPKPIVEQYYGEGVFYEDAFDELFPKVYGDAIDESGYSVVSAPQNVDIIKMSKADGLEFTVEAELKPEVEVKDYKGVKATVKPVKVGAKEVNAELEKVRKENERWIEVDREVAKGDTVVMDYSGSVDGVKFDGGTAEGQSLVVGSNSFIPGFEDQLVGMKAGEKKDITVTFPKEYPVPNLAGKEAVFAINMISVKESEVPELDDDFASDVSDFDTLAEYKKDIKKKLTERAKEDQKNSVEDQILKTVMENTEIDIPKGMIDSQIDQMIQEFQYQLMYQGMRLDDYFKATGETMEVFRGRYEDQAKQQVKMRLCIEAMIKQEGIEASDEEVDEKIKGFAQDANKTLEEYKKLLGDDVSYFKERVCVDKLFDILYNNAQIVEEEPEKKETKKAAKKDEGEKKPAAKKSEKKDDKEEK